MVLTPSMRSFTPRTYGFPEGFVFQVSKTLSRSCDDLQPKALQPKALQPKAATCKPPLSEECRDHVVKSLRYRKCSF